MAVVSRALDVDAAIFNLYYNVCKMDAERRDAYLAYMKESCMGKYQFPVDFFCVSPHYMKLDPETRKDREAGAADLSLGGQPGF